MKSPGLLRSVLDGSAWRGLTTRSVNHVCLALLRRRPARRIAVAVVLVEALREYLRTGPPATVTSLVFATVAAASVDKLPRLVLGAAARAGCTNDPAVKSAQVARAVESLCTERSADAVTELYLRGTLRHEYDVAYAVVMVERCGRTVDQIQQAIDRDYDQTGHRCARVYPPA